jgi:hypothetical protein
LEISVKRPSRGKAGQDFLPVANVQQAEISVANGQHTVSENLAIILQCMPTMKNSDFSVRLPVSWAGRDGHDRAIN